VVFTAIIGASIQAKGCSLLCEDLLAAKSEQPNDYGDSQHFKIEKFS